MSVEFYRESPRKFDSRTLDRKTLNRWTVRIMSSHVTSRYALGRKDSVENLGEILEGDRDQLYHIILPRFAFFIISMIHFIYVYIYIYIYIYR